jgi:acetyl esterase/lipase
LTNRRAGSDGVERTIQKFLEALAAGDGKPIEQMTATEARGVLVAAQSSVPVDLPKADVSLRTITSDGQTVKLVIVRPPGAGGTFPGFMFFHGGGWVLGDFLTHERLVRDLVAESGATAVFVEYDRSPEARYPTAIHQAYAATKWVATHGHEIGVDGRRLAVVGNSVGGNMAAVVSLMAKDRGAPNILFQLLFWPVTDARFDTPSYEQFADGHFLTRNMMRWFWDNYTTDQRERQDVYASPLQASLERLKGVAPALIQTAEMDVLRDATRYNGLIHDYGLLNPISRVPGVRSALLHAAAELKKRLQ